VVTVYDVTRAAGVSIASVSCVLNGQARVFSSTAERVRQVVRAMGYSPDEIARSPVAMTTRTISLLFPRIINPFVPELVNVQAVAAEKDHALPLVKNSDRPAKMLRARRPGRAHDGDRPPEGRADGGSPPARPGHRRIAHIARLGRIAVSASRRGGREGALRELGVPPDQDLVLEGNFFEEATC
jgi:DNA-binding LacI/PurR family transcriptional regulator